MSDLSPLEIANWVQLSVGEEAQSLYDDLDDHLDLGLETEANAAERLRILSALVSDPQMKSVWSLLFRKKRCDHRQTPEFFHPARVTHASWADSYRQEASLLRTEGGKSNELEALNLEKEARWLDSEEEPELDPRFTEQDRAAQILLRQAYHAAFDVEPEYLSNVLEKVHSLRKLAASLSAEEKILRSFGMIKAARKLSNVADYCDTEAHIMEPRPGNDPWIIRRERKDPIVFTFVTTIAISTKALFRDPLCGTIATLVNVLFPGNELKGPDVREMLRERPRG